MRKIATVLLAICTVATAYYFWDSSPENITNAQPEFTKKYQQWLHDRYKDPATGEIPKNVKQLELQFAREMKSHNPNFVKNNRIQSLNTWTSRGPYYMGGRSRAIALDIDDENRILAGGVDAGMWLSTDGGANWNKTTTATQLPSVTTIDQDKRPGKHNIWYHGTGERLGSRANGDGIYKSTDNGNSWFRLQSTVKGSIGLWDNPFDFVYRIRTNPNAPLDKDEVYAATSIGGIYRSEDGGEVWEPVLGGGVSNSLSLYTDLEVTSKGVFYATMSSNGTGSNSSIVKGIFRSTNGKDWTDITPTNFPKNYNRVVIGIDPKNENSMYFLGETPEFGLKTTNSQKMDLWHSLFKYEYKSGDGAGENGKWTELTDNLPNPELVRHQMNSQGGYDLLIKVHPIDSNVVYIGGVNLYRSDSGWKTKDFKVIGGTCPDNDCDYTYRYNNHHADLHTMIFLPSNPNIAFTGSDGGIHKTLDNKAASTEWISLNNGYLTTQFYSVGIDHATESGDIVGGLQDNGSIYNSSFDSKALWSDVLRGDGFNCAIADSSKFIITSKNSSYDPDINIYKSVVSKDGKIIKAARIDPIGGKDFIWNTPFMLDPNDNNKFYLAGGRTVWRNSDLSKVRMIDFPETGWKDVVNPDSISTEWTELTNTNVEDKDTTERITAISVSKVPANIVYYGTNNGKLYRIDNADKGNPKPIDLSETGFVKNTTVSSIAIDPDDASKVLVAFSNYNIPSLYYTTNSGATWTQVGGNLEGNVNNTGTGPAVNVVQIVKYNGKKAYLAGTSVGLFVTSYLNAEGTVWDQEAEQTIGYNNVFTLDFREIDGYTAVGTYATGAYATHFTSFPSAISGKVSLISPIDNTSNIEQNPILKWKYITDAFYYKLQVSSDANFENILFDKSNITETENELKNILSLGFKNYYWRVAAINSGGISPYSEVWQFQTGLGAPSLISPPNQSDNIPSSVKLTWEAFPVDAISYRVQLSANSFFSKIVGEGETLDNNYTFDNLEKGKKYFWRVKAYHGGDSSEYGEKFAFDTEPLSSVNNKELEKSISLYPNPATNYVKIDLNMIGTIPNSIKLYDSQGKLLRSFDYKIKSSVMNYDFDIRELQAGQYFIRLQFEKFTISKRFVKL